MHLPSVLLALGAAGALAAPWYGVLPSLTEVASPTNDPAAAQVNSILPLGKPNTTGDALDLESLLSLLERPRPPPLAMTTRNHTTTPKGLMTTTKSLTTTTKSHATTTKGLASKSTVPTLPGSSLLNPEAAASSIWSSLGSPGAMEALKNKPKKMMSILSILSTMSTVGPASVKSATKPAPTPPGGPASVTSAVKSTATNAHGPLDRPEFGAGSKDGVVGRIFGVLQKLKKLVRLIDDE